MNMEPQVLIALIPVIFALRKFFNDNSIPITIKTIIPFVLSLSAFGYGLLLMKLEYIYSIVFLIVSAACIIILVEIYYKKSKKRDIKSRKGKIDNILGKF